MCSWRGRSRQLPYFLICAEIGVHVGARDTAGDNAFAGACDTTGWAMTRRALWDGVGDGSTPAARTATLRAASVAPLTPSACLTGAASLHVVHLLQRETVGRENEVRHQCEELFAVLLGTSWLDVMVGGWPFFGLLHLLQTQLEIDIAQRVGEESPTAPRQMVGPGGVPLSYPAATGSIAADRWEPLESDDHMRFRNWIYSHLKGGQIPPLVDSVHFLARADPRDPNHPSRSCSAAKAMGYLATAYAFVQEADEPTHAEARELVKSAEMHFKECVAAGPSRFSLFKVLRTEWPLFWLLHSLQLQMSPPKFDSAVAGGSFVTAPLTPLTPPPRRLVAEEVAAVAENARSAIKSLVLVPPTGGAVATKAAAAMAAAAAHPLAEAASADGVPKTMSSLATPEIIGEIGAHCKGTSEELCELPPRVRRAFHDLGDGLHVVSLDHLEELTGLSNAGTLVGSRVVQVFRNGLPLRRSPQNQARCLGTRGSVRGGSSSGPFWAKSRLLGRTVISVKDPDFRSHSTKYALSLDEPRSIGLYSEPGSAADPYNAEWLLAYREAATRLGLVVKEASSAEEMRAGSMQFWRINQMFQGGRLAGAAGVGGAIAGHLEQLSAASRSIFWPRPETARVYQDKLALRELFERAGVPAPRSWVVTTDAELEALIASADLTASHFPLVLKHPYAASSRGMVACDSFGEVHQVVGAWLAEHRVPCLLQQRLRIDRDMRLTYVGGEIVHGYWRIKPSIDKLTTGTGQGGSRLDFRIPRDEVAPFVREFAARTGIDIGGMDIAFPGEGGPVVFEVSPTFDLNPEPPAEWVSQPYKDYKKTEDYMQRRAENYAFCAEMIIRYALGRRGRLFVDVDNTVSDSLGRLRRAAVPSWPGETFNAAQAFSPAELAQDPPVPGAASALSSLARDWEVAFLTARGFPGALSATAQWLRTHGFHHDRLIVVREARDKVDWLEEEMDDVASNVADDSFQSPRVLLIDDLTRGHHKAAPEPDEVTIRLLRERGIPFEIFRPNDTSWSLLARRLATAPSTTEHEKGVVNRKASRCDAEL